MHDSYDGNDDGVVVNDSGEASAESTQEAASTANTEVAALDDAHEGGGKSGEGGRNGHAGSGDGSGKTGESGTGGCAGKSAETQSLSGNKVEGGTRSGRIETGRKGKSTETEKAGESTEAQPLPKGKGEGSARSGRIETGRTGKSAESEKAGESTEAQPLPKDKSEGNTRSGRIETGRKGKSAESGKNGEADNADRNSKKQAESKEKGVSVEDKENAEKQEAADKSEQDRPGKYPPQSIVTVEGKRYRTDDNGNIHMFYDKETKEWNMVANKEYTSYGFKYRTDENGNIVHAEGKIDRSADRKPLNDKVPGLQEGDERGHIIADRNDASNHRDNLFPQLAEKNHGEYRIMEKHVAEAAADPNNDVHMSVDLEYPPNAEAEHRPDWVYVTVTINGHEENYQFDNRRDAS